MNLKSKTCEHCKTSFEISEGEFSLYEKVGIELPQDIKDVPDNIISQALICGESGWRFNISQNELIFYKENNIPLPRYHFDVRIKNSLKYLTILQSYPYKCSYCKKDIEAYYLPEWNYQKIACEECYKQNIN